MNAKKVLLSVFSAILIVFNSLSPFVSVVQADEPTGQTVSNSQTQSPSPSPAQSTDPTPSPSLSPSPSPSSTPDPSTTPSPTPVQEASTSAAVDTPQASSSATPAPVASDWQTDGSSSTTASTIELGKTYTAPQNSNVSVNFDKLPSNPGKLTIKEISTSTLSGVSPVTSTAYDISSDMVNGSFEYTLTLPTPTTDNVKVETSEDGKSFVAVGGVTPTGNTLTISGLNHFSIFVVTGVTSPSCTGASVTPPSGTASCYSTIDAAIANAVSGDTINIADGTYNETSTLNITTPNLTVAGTSQSGTIINSSSVNGYGIHIQANGVTLKNLTLTGPQISPYSVDYGIKIEGSSGINLNYITVQNAKKSGIDLNGVNSSTFANISVLNNGANGFALTDSSNDQINTIVTNGNSWGGIAVYVKGAFYPGGSSGVTISGDTSSESAGVYTGIDGPYTISSLSVDQSAFPYKISLSNSDPQDIYVRDLTTATAVASAQSSLHPTLHKVSDGSFIVTSGFKIQDAINSASPSATVNVLAGTYPEQVSINKNLTLTGASSSATIIQAPGTLVADTFGKNNIVDIIGGSTVTMSGFTVAGPGPSTCGSIDAGIAALDGSTLNLSSSIVRDIRDNPLSGCQNGEGIRIGTPRYSAISSVGHATISGVSVYDYQKNGIVVAGPLSTATISNNTVTGVGPTSAIAQNGIQVNGATANVVGNIISGNECNAAPCGSDPSTQSQAAGGLLFGALSGTTFTNNSISNNDVAVYIDSVIALTNNLFSTNRFANVDNESGSTITATNNDWGTYTSTGIASTIESSDPANNPVNFTPFLGGTAAVLTPTVNLTPSVSQVVVNNTTAPSTINIPSSVTNPTLDLSGVSTASGGTTTATISNTISISATTTYGTVTASIPAGTTITGSTSDWGASPVINAPQVLSVSPNLNFPSPPSGFHDVVGDVIEIGAGNVPLTLSNAVRLVFPGQAGSQVGFTRNGVFTQIASTCSADDQTTENSSLSAGSDCSITSGSDLVVWTKHFTEFVTYSYLAGNLTGSSSVSTSSTGGSSCGDTKPASAPTLLSAVASGANQITLTWSAGQGPFTYYLATYGLSSGAQQYGDPNVGGAGSTSYTISGLSGGTTYYFRVRAGNGCTPGDFSNELSTTATGGFIAGPAAGFAPGVLGVSTSASGTNNSSNGSSSSIPGVGEVKAAETSSGSANFDNTFPSASPASSALTLPFSKKTGLAALVGLIIAASLIYYFNRKRSS